MPDLQNWAQNSREQDTDLVTNTGVQKQEVVSGTKEQRITARHLGIVTNIYTLHSRVSKCFHFPHCMGSQVIYLLNPPTCARTHCRDEAPRDKEFRDVEDLAPTLRRVWSSVKYWWVKRQDKIPLFLNRAQQEKGSHSVLCPFPQSL